MNKRALIATRCFPPAQAAPDAPLPDLARRLAASGWEVEIHAEGGAGDAGGDGMILRRHGGPAVLRSWWAGRVVAAALRADAAVGAVRLVVCDGVDILARSPSGALRRHRVLGVLADAPLSLSPRRVAAAVAKADLIAAPTEDAARRLRALAPDAQIAVAGSGAALALLCAAPEAWRC